MSKLGMASKAAENTMRHEKTFAVKGGRANKRKRPNLTREARGNTHLEGTAAGDELHRARQQIMLEKGR